MMSSSLALLVKYPLRPADGEAAQQREDVSQDRGGGKHCDMPLCLVSESRRVSRNLPACTEVLQL